MMHMGVHALTPQNLAWKMDQQRVADLKAKITFPCSSHELTSTGGARTSFIRLLYVLGAYALEGQESNF